MQCRSYLSSRIFKFSGFFPLVIRVLKSKVVNLQESQASDGENEILNSFFVKCRQVALAAEHFFFTLFGSLTSFRMLIQS